MTLVYLSILLRFFILSFVCFSYVSSMCSKSNKYLALCTQIMHASEVSKYKIYINRWLLSLVMQYFVKIMMSKYRGRFLRLVQIPCHPNMMLFVALRWLDDGSLLFQICRSVLFWESFSTGKCETDRISYMARVCTWYHMDHL